MAAKLTTGKFEATSRTHCEDGYANLAIQEIGGETLETSIAVHSLFDSKRTLAHVFLRTSLHRFMSGSHYRGKTLTEKLDRMRDGIELFLLPSLRSSSSQGVMP